MIKGIMDWVDDRSGIRGLVKEALYEKVPGGARWRYVWGSCLTFVFFTQGNAGLDSIKPKILDQLKLFQDA